MIASVPALLHNSGYFGFSKAALALLALQCLVYPVTLACAVALAYFSWKKKTAVAGVFLVLAIAGAAMGISRAKPVRSAYLYAKGFALYLCSEDERARDCFARCLSNGGAKPVVLQTLLKMYSQESPDSQAIAGLHGAVKACGDANLLYQSAMLFERAGCITNAMADYEAAYSLHRDERYLLKAVDAAVRLRLLSHAQDIMDAVNREGHPQAGRAFSHCTALLCYEQRAVSRMESAAHELEKCAFLNEKDLTLLGKMYRATGQDSIARRFFLRAIAFRHESPEAYYQLGLLCMAQKEFGGAASYFRESRYFENRNAKAFVLENACRRTPVATAEPAENGALQKALTGPDSVDLIVGQTKPIVVSLRENQAPGRFAFGMLEPYGFGVQVELDSEVQSAAVHTAYFTATGKRSSSVNLNKPWVVRCVVFDKATLAFASKDIFVRVSDRKGAEGRIFFVITEDLEQIGGFPHGGRNPKKFRITAADLHADLVSKVAFGDSIANENGIKWTHMVEFGSALLRPKLLSAGHYGGMWDNLFGAIARGYAQSLARGNDIQLHVHAYAVPGNRLNRQFFDTASGCILFAGNKEKVQDGSGKNGAWAYNYSSLGKTTDWESRSGSVARGKMELESILGPYDSAYSTIAFRAGEYEFGDPGDETEKSVAALRWNNILCASDAYEGDLFTRSFHFYDRAGKNVYFSKEDDIHYPADNLLDAGILQIIPVPEKDGQDYIEPVSNWRNVEFNYGVCMDKGKIKNGIFILPEMYHLINTNWKYDCNRLQRGYEDWGRMERQFLGIRKHCPKMECVTLSQAARAYLNRFSPDAYTVLREESCSLPDVKQFGIEINGDGIDISGKRPHYLVVSVPCFENRSIEHVEVLHAGKVEQSVPGADMSGLLEFMAAEKTNYSLRVTLGDCKKPIPEGDDAARK